MSINTTINITKRGRLLLDLACEKDKRTLQAEVEVIMEDYCVRNQIDISKIEQQKVEK